MELEKAIGRGNSREVAGSDRGAIELAWAAPEDPEEPLRTFKQQCGTGVEAGYKLHGCCAIRVAGDSECVKLGMDMVPRWSLAYFPGSFANGFWVASVHLRHW